MPEIVSEHLLKGRIVTRLLYQETVVDENTTKSLNETKFYAKQMRIARGSPSSTERSINAPGRGAHGHHIERGC